jgi:type IV secretory pathway VirB10-like protein
MLRKKKTKLKNKTKNQMNPGGGDEQLCDPTKAQLYYYYPDLVDGYYPNPYEQYDEEEEEEEVDEAMDVNADVMTTIQPEQQQQEEPDEMQLTGEVTIEADQLASVDATVQNEVLKQKTTTTEAETRELNGDPCASVASTNGGTGRRKKRRKKRNKTTTTTATADDEEEEALDRTESLQLPQASQPLARVRHSPLSLGSPIQSSITLSIIVSLSLSLSVPN